VGRSGSVSRTGGKALPVAQPLDDVAAAPASPLDFLQEIEESGAGSNIRRASGSLSDKPRAAYRHRRKGIPIWLWLAIGGGALLAIVMLVLAIITAQS
jgi:hypothetical protein